MVSGIVVLAASADIDVDTTFENVVVSVVVVVSGRVVVDASVVDTDAIIEDV